MPVLARRGRRVPVGPTDGPGWVGGDDEVAVGQHAELGGAGGEGLAVGEHGAGGDAEPPVTPSMVNGAEGR